MARTPFKLPDIGEGIAEAEIVAWHVKVGDRIEEDDPLCDMMTDKATVEMTAPVSGTVIEVAGEVGDQIAIGAVLAVFETAAGAQVAAEPTIVAAPAEVSQVALSQPIETVGETDEAKHDVKPSPPVGEGLGEGGDGAAERSVSTSETSLPSPPPEGGREPVAPEAKRILASPAVRARAKDLGVDLAQVHAPDGRVRHADLDAYVGYKGGQGYRAAAAAPRADEQIRVVGLRRRIAENMLAAKRAIPHFTYVDEIDVTKLEALREDLNAARGDKPRLTMLPLLITALCKALPEFPMLNARYDDAAGIVTRRGAVHLGIADANRRRADGAGGP